MLGPGINEAGRRSGDARAERDLMRADRLLSIMLLLHARRRMTAADLAEELTVSERTIYRDLDALSVAGIPVYTQPGTGGGIFLDEHYRISLTGLSRGELHSLFVASGSGPLADLGLAQPAEQSLLKLLAALPTIHRAEVERLRARIYIDPANWMQTPQALPHLVLLQQAVWEDRVIRFCYQQRSSQRVMRTVAALGLVAKANLWYCIGRKDDGDLRVYRASRMSDVTLTGAFFERPDEFDLPAYWAEACARFEAEMQSYVQTYPVVMRVHRDLLWYFEDFRPDRFTILDPPDADGWARLQIDFPSHGDAQMHALGLGTSVHVETPPELARWVVAQARALVQRAAASGSEG